MDRLPNEEYCIPKCAKPETYAWRTGRLIGSDPATAQHYRCTIPQSDGKPCVCGKYHGKQKYTSGNTSNLMNNHHKIHHGTHYDRFKSTSVKSLNAAATGAGSCASCGWPPCTLLQSLWVIAWLAGNSGGHYSAGHTTARTLATLRWVSRRC